MDGTYNGTLHQMAKEACYEVLVTRDYKMRNETRPLMAVLTVPTPFADAERVMRIGDEIVDALAAICKADVEPRYHALDPHPDERRATRLRNHDGTGANRTRAPRLGVVPAVGSSTSVNQFGFG